MKTFRDKTGLSRTQLINLHSRKEDMDKDNESAVIAQFRRQLLTLEKTDDEWDSLFLYQLEYREKNCISAKRLLIDMNLPITLLQFLYSNLSRPSMRQGTLGRSLRDHLLELKSTDRVRTESQTDCTPLSLDIFLENHQAELVQFGVLTMNLSDEILVAHVELEKFDKEKFENFVNSTGLAAKEKKYLSSSFLNSFGSPFCTTTEEGAFGTTTILNLGFICLN